MLNCSDISDNELKWVDEGIFDGLYSLEDVTLKNNKIVAFPQLSLNLTSLKNIDLSNNMISNIGLNFFANVPKKFKGV